MNKYELGIKIDQIKKLAAKKEYTEAAAIAKELNWTKVKDWQALATAINVQEAVGDYEEARDMAILAYNRNLGGRKLVYKLTEFFIKVGDFDNANELYEEYSRLWKENGREQGKPQKEIIIGNVYDKIEDAGIWLPLGELYKYYESHISKFRKRYEKTKDSFNNENN